MTLFDRKLIRKINWLAKESTWNVFCEQICQYLMISQVNYNHLPPKRSPILLICNHNSILDSLILGKLITRKDYYFVALAAYSLLGPKISVQAIPVYRKLMLNHLIFEYPLSIVSKRPIRRFDQTTIRANNRASITMAAAKLNQGGLVSIFPTGSAGRKINGSHWKPGVGHLIKQVTNPEVSVVFCEISGTRRSDILLFLHPFLRKKVYNKHIVPSANFSTPVNLTKLIDMNESARQIALKLENHYIKFSHTLKK